MSILGSDVQSSLSNIANNTISFNPIISAITGTGSTAPTVTAPVTASPTSAADARGGTDTASLPFLNGASSGSGLPSGRIDTSQAYGGAGLGATGNGVSLGVKTNSQTMLWMMLIGGFGLVMLMPMGGGRHR